MHDAIRKTVRLPCGPDRAFVLFTRQIHAWWPPERRHTGGPLGNIELSALGGFYEQGGDGQRVELGRVLVWDPPRRLELDWYPGTDPEHPTRVIVSFVPDGEYTCVEVVHGPTPASLDLFDARAPRYEASWALVLAAYEAWASRDHA